MKIKRFHHIFVLTFSLTEFSFTEDPVPCAESSCPAWYWTKKKMKKYWKKNTGNYDLYLPEEGATGDRQEVPVVPLQALVGDVY